MDEIIAEQSAKSEKMPQYWLNQFNFISSSQLNKVNKLTSNRKKTQLWAERQCIVNSGFYVLNLI